MSSRFKIDWEESEWEGSDGMVHWGFIHNHSSLWPGVSGSPMAASVYLLGGKWYGRYWAKCSSSHAGDIPPCDTPEEAKAVVTMLLRLDS